MAAQPEWKQLKLSLERPYKDDDGKPIPVVLDITPEGQHIYEPYVSFPDNLTIESHSIML